MILFNSISKYLIYSEYVLNLYEYVLNLFENMHIAGQPHTAAPLDSCTLPCALPQSRTA
jgi:hypothetical protein